MSDTQFETAAEYADYILRYAATCPCLMELSDLVRDPRCECYGCAGRKYVALSGRALPGGGEPT